LSYTKRKRVERAEKFIIDSEPFYLPQADEIEVAAAAYRARMPLLLKGPTGCGKTRFMEYLAWRLDRPLITVSCHDDLSASDLTGRYLIRSGETVWMDGPLTMAVKMGAICYLDEIVEARKDTTVIIHPLADDRRQLPIEKLGEVIEAPDEFMLTVSYNPGYQSVLKDLKPSTRQRFVAIYFDYPDPDREKEIVVKESGVDSQLAERLVRLGRMTRNLKDQGLIEGASTRLLVHTGRLIAQGIEPKRACELAMCQPLTDDAEIISGLMEMIRAVF
jgi:nitric oxide reductase NorQ protein